MKLPKLFVTLSSVALCALTLGVPPICFAQQVTVPSNVQIGEEPFGGDATDNPLIDTRTRRTEQNSRTAFEFPSLGVKLSSAFDGGRFNHAARSDDGTLVLFIDSENYPINDSPWYCFRISRMDGTTADNIKLRLTYPTNTQGDGHKGTHRYRPKLSRDGGRTWESIEPKRYDHDKAEMTLAMGDFPLLISAQELETSQRSREWAEKLAEKPCVSIELLGRTPLGKEIPMLHIVEGKADGKSELFVMGRQHPPEVTGELAMRRFVEYLAGKEADAQEFRSRFNVRVIPMVNPDGVDQGHWRHNTGGADLNRDWSESTKHGREPLFNQPETRIVAAAFKRFDDRHVAFAVDFHSTHHDVFYLLTDEYRDVDDDVAMNWIFRLARSLPQRKLVVHKLAEKAYYSTALAWMNRRFGCPGAVYEVGDETPRDELAVVAENAARALISELMSPTRMGAKRSERDIEECSPFHY